MWRLIRGAGLSYSYSLVLKPNEGLIKFQLFKATNGSEAYSKAKQIIVTKSIVTFFSETIDNYFQMFFFFQYF